MYFLLRFVPKNLLSLLVGSCAYLRLPKPVTSWLIHWFANRYGASLEEASCKVSEYCSLGAFFVRDLRDGARPVDSAMLVSPVDGRLTEAGRVENGTLLQVKGMPYSLASLLQDAQLSLRFTDGYFLTLYLAPGDYHHIHAPCAGHITQSIHIPGKLWPVNTWSVNSIENLFCVNERIVSLIEGVSGAVCVVKVGATNVGSIRTTYNDFCGNQWQVPFRRRRVERAQYQPGIAIEKAARVGSFYLGSTVVLLLESSWFERIPRFRNGRVLLGEKLEVDLREENSGREESS